MAGAGKGIDGEGDGECSRSLKEDEGVVAAVCGDEIGRKGIRGRRRGGK